MSSNDQERRRRPGRPRVERSDPLQRTTIMLPESLLRAINSALDERDEERSRNTWILDALSAYLTRAGAPGTLSGLTRLNGAAKSMNMNPMNSMKRRSDPTWNPIEDDPMFATLLAWRAELDTARQDAHAALWEAVEQTNAAIGQFGSFSPEVKEASAEQNRRYEAFAEAERRHNWLYDQLCEYARISNYDLPDDMFVEELRG